jgi:hypothetical protein
MKLIFKWENKQIKEVFIPDGYPVPERGEKVILEDDKFKKKEFTVTSREFTYSSFSDRNLIILNLLE